MHFIPKISFRGVSLAQSVVCMTLDLTVECELHIGSRDYLKINLSKTKQQTKISLKKDTNISHQNHNTIPIPRSEVVF